MYKNIIVFLFFHSFFFICEPDKEGVYQLDQILKQQPIAQGGISEIYDVSNIIGIPQTSHPMIAKKYISESYLTNLNDQIENEINLYEQIKNIENAKRERGEIVPDNSYIPIFYGCKSNKEFEFVFIEALKSDFSKSKLYEKVLNFSLKERFGFYRRLLEKIIYLHNNGFSHCDIKMENFMLVSDNEIKNLMCEFKVIDFGSATKSDECPRGTNAYSSPERFQKVICSNIIINRSFLADSFSLGQMLIEFEIGSLEVSNNWGRESEIANLNVYFSRMQDLNREKVNKQEDLLYNEFIKLVKQMTEDLCKRINVFEAYNKILKLESEFKLNI